MKKQNTKCNRKCSRRYTNELCCILVSMTMILILSACGIIAEKYNIVAEEISSEVERLDIAPIVIDDPEEQGGNVSEEIMGFSVALLQMLEEEATQENVLISPYSILTALAMAGNGAEGETLAQMEEVLGTDIDSLNEFFYAYSSNFLPSDDKYKVNVANSIWIKDSEDLEVSDAFLSLNKSYYDASIYRAAFDETTLNDINDWVSNETDGMIEDILGELDVYAVMYLVNAVAFDAEWEDIYKTDQVREMEFTSASGEIQTVEFLWGDEYEYIELEGATGFSKPYADDAYSFVALLPDGDMEEFLVNLDGVTLGEALESGSREKVITYIPKFSFEYDIELSEVLTDMGMEDAFVDDIADFSQMATSTDGNIYINKVLHKTFITVDEKGTEAGAATVIEMVTESASVENPKEVRLDRPFLFMIVDNEMHLPIFMGIVESVE